MKFLLAIILISSIAISNCAVVSTDIVNLKETIRNELKNILKNYTEITDLEGEINSDLGNSNDNTEEKELISLFQSKIVETVDQNSFKNLQYDGENRIFLNNIISDYDDIIAFNILHYRTISRHDNGFFSTFYFILAFSNKIKIYDSANILIAEKEFNFFINDVVVFNTQEEMSFYLVTDEEKSIRKFRFYIKKFDRKVEDADYGESGSVTDEIKNQSNHINDQIQQIHEFQPLKHISTEGDKITIRTFKENVNAYDIMLYYKNNLKKFRWSLEETNIYKIEEGRIEKIIKHINKGNKILLIIKNDGEIYSLDEDLNLVRQVRSALKGSNLMIEFTQVAQNYISFIFSENPNQILFYALESGSAYTNSTYKTTNKTALNCDISNFIPLSRSIKNYFFDTYLQLVFVILDNFEFFIFTPKVNEKAENKENICIFVKSVNFYERIEDEEQINFTNISISIDILRKDLIILDYTNQKLIILDLTDFDLVVELQERQMSYYTIDLQDFREKFDLSDLRQNDNIKESNRLENTLLTLSKYNFVACKYTHGHYILIRRNQNTVLFLELVNPSNKLKGTEDYSFNFKIPIIFIALVILFFYQYMKNKNNQKEIYEKDKQELMQKLKNYGVFNEGKGKQLGEKRGNPGNSFKGKKKRGDDGEDEESVSDEEDEKHFENKMKYLLGQHMKKTN